MDDLQPFDAERYVYGLFAEGLEKELEKSKTNQATKLFQYPATRGCWSSFVFVL